MSAPEAKAQPPSPVRMTVRIAGLAANSSTARPSASYMSRDSAFSRAGLLRMIQPSAPSLRAMSFAGSLAMASDNLPFAQRFDLRRAVAQRAQHLLRRLAGRGRG